MSASNEYLLKICAVGSGKVGKTALIRKFAENKFDTNYLPTLGVDITTKKIQVDDTQVKLILVDTAGQEFFGKLRPSYYRGASAVSIFFNRGDRLSFHAVTNWLNEFRKYVQPAVPLALVGITFGSDLVSSEEGKELAKTLNGRYFECPSTNGPYIHEVFESLSRQVIGLPDLEPIEPPIKESRISSSIFRNGDILDIRFEHYQLRIEHIWINQDTRSREEVERLWIRHFLV